MDYCADIRAAFRWLPGVLGNQESADQDSFATGLLDHSHYTRPAQWCAWQVEHPEDWDRPKPKGWRFRA